MGSVNSVLRRQKVSTHEKKKIEFGIAKMDVKTLKIKQKTSQRFGKLQPKKNHRKNKSTIYLPQKRMVNLANAKQIAFFPTHKSHQDFFLFFKKKPPKKCRMNRKLSLQSKSKMSEQVTQGDTAQTKRDKFIHNKTKKLLKEKTSELPLLQYKEKNHCDPIQMQARRYNLMREH